jgi:hypothetical protein
MNIPRIVRNYFNVTFLYGFARGVYKTHDSSHSFYNHQTGRRDKTPKLITEKAGDALHHAFAAPIVWPLMLSEDAVHLEIYMRNKDPAMYGRKPYCEE